MNASQPAAPIAPRDTRVLIAPYPFKGTLTSRQAAEAIASGLRRVMPGAEPHLLPLGDGGSGTLDALRTALGGDTRTHTCPDALGRPHACSWSRTPGGDAIVEAAQAIALAALAPAERDPAHLTTTGLGSLITAAYASDASRILIGLGDTATHDCGLGVGAAFGYRFFDAAGVELAAIGASLADLAHIDVSGATMFSRRIEMLVYCDVLNPLLGSDGAALRFASQKGASPAMVELLERGGERFAEIVERDLGMDVRAIPGAGAAGGLGAGLAAFCGARLTGGAGGVLDATGFAERVERSDLVITGEGRLDAKTLLGKGVGTIARRMARGRARLLVVAGSIEGDRDEWERRLGARVVVLDNAVGDAGEAVARAVAEDVGKV